jgi:hypothetical protein
MSKTETGDCSLCGKQFSYYLIHNGFNNTSYAYCDTCGCTAFFSAYSTKPDGVVLEPFQKISRNVETYLQQCACGGHFRAVSSPRCPHCHQPLSGLAATTWIEANAPGAAKGWRWQKDWDGLYSIVVDDRRVNDPWKADLLSGDGP